MEQINQLIKELNEGWKTPLDPETIRKIQKKLELLNLISDVVPYLVQAQPTIDQNGNYSSEWMLTANGMGRKISDQDKEKIKDFTRELVAEQQNTDPIVEATVVVENENK